MASKTPNRKVLLKAQQLRSTFEDLRGAFGEWDKLTDSAEIIPDEATERAREILKKLKDQLEDFDF